jgi:O-antigen polymerase
LKRTLIYSTLISLILITPFIYSDNLYNGIISAKQIWFYGAVALLILAYGIDLLFLRKNVSFTLNIIDISLLTFYVYFFIRTVYTSYTPILYNIRFLNYSLLILFYFIVKYFNSGSVFTRTTDNLKYSDELEKRETITLPEILVVVLMLTGLVEAIWGLLQLYGMTRSFHSGFKITGTFFNPAPYSLYLAAIFPIALGTLLQIKDLKNERIKEFKIKELKNLRKPQFYSSISQFLHYFIYSFLHYFTPSLLIPKLTYYISLLTVISIILVLPATMNRASWLGVLAGSLMAFNYRYNLFNSVKIHLRNIARKLSALILIILLVGFSVTGLYFLKKGSSIGKLLIWEVTAGKIWEKPLFGHGVGRFEAEYNNWQASYFRNHTNEMDCPKGMAAGNTKYCFNEYLEMAAEIGIIGILLFLGVIVSVFSGTRKAQRSVHRIQNAINDNRMTAQPNNARDANYTASLVTPSGQMTSEIKELGETINSLIPSLLVPSFISLLVCALISFPFYSLPTLIVFFLLLAILSSHVEGIHLSERFKVLSLIQSFTRTSTHSIFSTFIRRSFSIVGLLTLSVLLLLLTKQQYKLYCTWDEAVMLYQTSSYGETCKSFSEIYVPLQYTGSYLQYYGKALYLNEEYAKSKTLFERAGKFNTDDILYCSLGDSYKACNMYYEAEEAYRYASFMVPHKFYSWYLLANLYDETGQKGNALRTAEEVLNKKIKVKSTATQEIIQAMRELIEKIKKRE